jgi:acetyl-CoA acyltransferase
VEEALAGALHDAGLAARHVQVAYVGNALEGAITGQEAMRAPTVLRRTGLMGVPIFRVENADASSSTALHMAWQAVAYGVHDCAVAVGYEKLDHADREKTYRAVNSCMDLGEVPEMFGAGSGAQPSLGLRLSGAFAHCWRICACSATSSPWRWWRSRTASTARSTRMRTTRCP